MNKNNNLIEEYKIKVKENISKIINNGQLFQAKELIMEYEKSIKNDIEIYSIKAVVAVIESRLDDAEEILREGLGIDSQYYDLLYNMAYVQQLKGNNELAKYFNSEAEAVLNKDKFNDKVLIELQPKKSKYTSEEEKKKNAPRVLIGSTIRQKTSILREFLQSLSELYIQDYNVNFMFFDDNEDLVSSQMLNNFKIQDCETIILRGEKQGRYICDDISHQWKDELIWKVAEYKDRIIDYAKENDYDYLFLVDSDLVLHPETLEKLISTKKDIISEVFWTKWNSSDIEKPQVWVSGNYTLYYKAENEVLTEEEITSRTNAFIKSMRIPGVYEVGGLGACTLISKQALDKGVCYKKLDSVNYRGEDRHFCIRALRMGLKLYVETSIPAYHIYREEYLKGVEDYKNKCRKSIIYRYDTFTRTAVKSKSNTLTLCMLVKNEADRYLENVLKYAAQYIDRAVILDDGSTDNTVEVCKRILKDIPLTIVSNKVSGFNNEVNLRKQLWDMAVKTNPDWILCLDADEIFEDKVKYEITNLINQPYYDYYDFRLYDFWDKEHYREDKYWCAHKYYRSFLVRYQPNFIYVWNETPVHCGRLPLNIYNLPGAISNLRIKHYGWCNEKERIEKYDRYMSHDPEGRYGVVEQYDSILDEIPNLVEWKE
ncbi:glycosyltransferase [Clostridium sp. OS1-26]|uniref:glycosyltransferase n=1 Tax=Clostridium sp. OS1-26 TaxID=3070681 RepID=UPI0027E15D6A|nr:glycosyltransferase [Clostridium sp. OS1-26]WML35489.1 glycosyltransferase [Clostridium sp. OS1-26]